MKTTGMRTKTTGVFPIDGRGGDVVGGVFHAFTLYHWFYSTYPSHAQDFFS